MTRQQISVALNDQELELLDELRGTIPRGVFMRTLLLQRRPVLNIIERIARLKRAYFVQYNGQNPTEIFLTPSCEHEIERLTWEELGDLVSGVIRDGSRSLKILLGLIIKWDYPEAKGLTVRGEGGSLCERDI